MTTDDQGDAGTTEPGEATMIQVPSSIASEVLDFIASLDDTDDDVSGHALSLVGSSQFRAELTNCKHTGANNTDWSCADVTTW